MLVVVKLLLLTLQTVLLHSAIILQRFKKLLNWLSRRVTYTKASSAELKKYFVYLFFYREEGREKERERNVNVWLPLVCPQLGTWPTTQACALTRNRTHDPLFHRLVLNPLSHTSQGFCGIFVSNFDVG